MEHDLSCEVCFLEYNGTAVIPLVLDCGHSFCKSCIARLGNSVCPKCRTEIPANKTFPVNHSFMSLVEEYKKPSKDDSPDITCRIQNLKEKLSSFPSIEADLKNLSSVSEDNSSEELIRKRKARKELKEMEEKYRKLFMNIANLENLDIISPSFSLLESGSKINFLLEVYKALKNSEKVFAMKSIDKKLKFGKVMVWDNKILIYSLTSDKIPDGAKSVLFQDLKECTRNGELHIFLEIAGRNEISHLIIIKLEDSKLCPNFIKLCTGESGPSYQNKPYKRNERRTKCNKCRSGYVIGAQQNCNWCGLNRKDFDTSVLYVDISEGLPADYYKNIPKSVACEPKDVILTEGSNDGFHIERVVIPKEYEIMGRVIYPLNILDYMPPRNSIHCMILGCGIMLEL